MADNVVANSVPVATRNVTYSGDASQNLQAIAPVLVTGSDDAKVATDVIPVSAGLDSTGAGVQAVGILAQFDDASTAAVTENQYASPRISSRRALLVEGVSGATAVKVDGSAVTQPVSGTVTANAGTASTAAQTSVASSASSVSLLASNGSRKMAMLFNDSTAILYVFFGSSAATTANFTVQLAAGAYYELPRPVFTGELRGIWASANGNARITELT